MTKYILAGGYVHKAKDGGKAFCEELVRGFNQTKPVKILDCMFARPRDVWVTKLHEDKEFFSKHVSNFELDLALPEKFIEQLKNSDVLFLRGGYTKVLMKMLSECGNWTKELYGKTVAGTSAGAEVLCRYYFICKTSRIGDGFNLLPVKFIPHWHSDSDEYLNFDWDKALQELKNYKEELPIYTLAEGECKVVHSTEV